MLKLLLAATVVAAPIVAPAAEPDTIMFVQYPLVHLVDCDEGRGTAFRVGKNHWFSVAHVTSMHNCAIDGEPITVTEQDGALDFSRLDTPLGVPNGMKVDCHGFIAGRYYWAIGHARGLPFQTAELVYATFAKAPDGKRILIGPYTFIPGMSGGPVLDPYSGEVVGTINAYLPGTPISLSRELSSTSVCSTGYVRAYAANPKVPAASLA